MTISTISPIHSELTHPKYRADIDGLRAIAVLSVVIFHAFPKYLRGGFIGVDIFFVISGFLISTIVIGSLERNSFSFVEFYSRRIKRIFPALLLVLISSFVFGWFALHADEYKQLGKHIAGGASFISNFLFWNESGYFDNSAETKPLLHLWSLGIEEQFYILWPLLLWLAWKRRFNLLTITIVVIVISFALNISKVHGDVVAAFYSPQTRFWELLTGSILAYMTLHSRGIFIEFKHKFDSLLGKVIYTQVTERKSKTMRNVQSILGAVLILTGLLLITKERQFPGWWAALPTLGAALIISAGMHAWFNRVVLSNRVLVWVGLISFPLYLWHWPLLSFARIVESEMPSRGIRIAAVLTSVVLAWLTYKLIEKPIRQGNNSKVKTITLFISMIVIAIIGFKTYEKNGLAFRAGAQPEVKNVGDLGNDEIHKYTHQRFYLCTPMNIQKEALVWNDAIRCLQSKNSDLKTIAIIGDSHAEHLFIGLSEALTDSNIVYYIKSSLPYIKNKEFENIFKSVIGDPNIRTVILSAYWSARLNKVPEGSSLKSVLAQTVNELTNANKTVYIAEDVPNFSFDPQKCKSSRKFSKNITCDQDRKFFYDQHSKYYPTLQSIVNDNKKVQILKMAEYFCGRNSCSMAKNGALLYRDRNHLGINGSKYLGVKLIGDNPQLVN